MKLEDTVAVVTGAASGLGLATVRALLEAGARAAILDREDSAGREVAAELGEGAIFTAADVTSEDKVSIFS
ncbi:MAG: SDR family NAD(P)-dependent oxidoreductase [Candidatus Binatia bacterium]